MHEEPLDLSDSDPIKAIKAGSCRGMWSGRLSRANWLGLACTAALFFVPVFLESHYWIGTLSLVWIWSILALSVAVLLGMGGLLSVAHGALFGTSAYVVALLTVDGGIGFWLASLLAVVACSAIGAMLGFITKDLAGHYFTIATLAFGVSVRAIVEAFPELTHGARGVSPVPTPEGPQALVAQVDNWLYWLTLSGLALTLVVVNALRNSGFGRVLEATRDNRVFAESLGVSIRTVRTYAFGLSASMAGVAGALYSAWAVFVSPTDTSFLIGFEAAIFAVIGGMHSLVGPVLGALVGTLVPEVLRIAEAYRLGLFGLLLILFIVAVPDGLVGMMVRLSRRFGADQRGGGR